MKIVVTGGSGLVGSELKNYLPEALYPSSKELNLLNSDNIASFLKKTKPDYVIHLAAHVGSLHDNIRNRCEYFDNNILINTFLTMLCAKNEIHNFLENACFLNNNSLFVGNHHYNIFEAIDELYSNITYE